MADNFLRKLATPGASMSNSLMPRPSRSGSVIGPPKIKMPQRAGQKMPQMSPQMPKASLGRKTGSLPHHPSLNVGGTASLLQTKSPLQRIGH